MTSKDNNTHINCPECNAHINIKEALAKSFKSEFMQKERKELLKEVQKDFKININEKDEKIDELSSKVIDLNTIREENLKLKREKKEIASSLSLQKEEEFQNAIDKFEYSIKEKDIAIDRLKDDLNKMQKGINQASSQLIGEAKELVIEEWLKDEFPNDNIKEIKKGAKGSDCIHEININNNVIGRICIESKRTEKFQKDWIKKIKENTKEHKCQISIIVSDVLPSNLEKLQQNGVWICKFSSFKYLIHAFRNTICEKASMLNTLQNKTDKMSLLYNYIISPDFYQNVETFVLGLVQQQELLNKEKRSLQSLWKKRETEIDNMMKGVANIYGSIRGITGNSLKDIESLELTNDNNLLKLTHKKEKSK